MFGNLLASCSYDRKVSVLNKLQTNLALLFLQISRGVWGELTGYTIFSMLDWNYCTCRSLWKVVNISHLQVEILPALFSVLSDNRRQKSWHACPLLQHLSGKTDSVLFIVMNLSLLVSNIVEREGGSLFQWCHYWLFPK